MYEVFSSTEGGTKVSLLAIVVWYLLTLLLVVGKSVKNVQEFFFTRGLITREFGRRRDLNIAYLD